MTTPDHASPVPDPVNNQPSPVEQTTAPVEGLAPPATPRIEGLRITTAVPIVSDWIAPDDIKPAKGFEAWHERLFDIGTDGKREAAIAALEGALVRLNLSKDVKLSPKEPLVFVVESMGRMNPPGERAFRVVNSVGLTPEIAGKVLFLLQFSSGLMHPVYPVKGKVLPEVINGSIP